MPKLFGFVGDIAKKFYYGAVGKNINAEASFAESSFTVVDLETTGFYLPPVCRIIEIGAVRIENLKIVREFSMLVNPLKSIPPVVTELTGIKNSDLKSAAKVGDALKEFFRFSAGSIITAYNVNFDFEFIKWSSRYSLGYMPKGETLCTFELTKKLLYFLDRYDLDVVADYFNIKIHNRHRALGDARATAELFILLLDILKKIGINSYAEAKALETDNLIPKEAKILLEHYRRLSVI